MPQFLPLWWLNLISWLFAILSLQVWFLQATALPNALHLQLARLAMLFALYEPDYFLLCDDLGHNDRVDLSCFIIGAR
jgi:hypothetical protein